MHTFVQVTLHIFSYAFSLLYYHLETPIARGWLDRSWWVKLPFKHSKNTLISMYHHDCISPHAHQYFNWILIKWPSFWTHIHGVKRKITGVTALKHLKTWRRLVTKNRCFSDVTLVTHTAPMFSIAQNDPQWIYNWMIAKKTDIV